MTRSRPLPREVATVTGDLIAGRCGDSPSADLLVAIGQFNRGEFWECHETLERLWLEEPEPLRVLYKGILHVGVGLLHLRRENLHGAVTKLSSGIQMLQPFGPQCLGVQVGALVQEAIALLEKLERSTPDALELLVRQPAPKLAVRSDADAAR